MARAFQARTLDIESGDYLRIKQAVLRSAPWHPEAVFGLIKKELAFYKIVALYERRQHPAGTPMWKALQSYPDPVPPMAMRFSARVPGSNKTVGFKEVSAVAHRLGGWVSGQKITEICRYDGRTFPGMCEEFERGYRKDQLSVTSFFTVDFTIAFKELCCGLIDH